MKAARMSGKKKTTSEEAAENDDYDDDACDSRTVMISGVVRKNAVRVELVGDP